eukprot:12986529-Alexandrium_andersonii.AAC.1
MNATCPEFGYKNTLAAQVQNHCKTAANATRGLCNASLSAMSFAKSSARAVHSTQRQRFGMQLRHAHLGTQLSPEAC